MKRVLSVVLSFVLLCGGIFAIPAYAAETAVQDGISVTLVTDKESYSAYEVIKATLTVQNTSSIPVKNVETEVLAPDGVKLAVGGKTRIAELPSGEVHQQTSTFIGMEAEVPSVPQTGDPSHVGLWIVLLILSFLASIYIVVFKKSNAGNRWMSLFLCILILGSLMPDISTVRAETIRKTITVTKTVYVDDKPVVITGIVTYDAAFEDDATQTYTVTWLNHDGTELEKDENVAYGTMPEYNGATPEKAADAEHSYTFTGWSPAITAVKSNVIYTAQYQPSSISPSSPFEYKIKDNTVSIVKYIGNLSEVVVPDTIDGLPVTEIGVRAFASCAFLTDVSLPAHLERIEREAFKNNSMLTEINLPESLTFIAEDAFDGPEKVTVNANPGTYAYQWAVAHGYIDAFAISDVTADKAAVIAGENILWTANVTGGKEPLSYRWDVYWDAKVEYTSTFAVPTLTYAPMHSGSYTVKVIVNDAEGNSTEKTGGSVSVSPRESTPVEDFTFTILNDTYCSLTRYTGTDTEIVLPTEDAQGHIVQTIGQNAFKDNTNLKSVVISNTVETIESSAFESCLGLMRVILPEGLKTIERYAFANCRSLQFIHLPDSIETSAGTMVLPSSVTEIGDAAFFGDSNIDDAILPEGILGIGENAFDRTSLTTIRLPSSLHRIADNSFDNTELETIEAAYGTYSYDWAYTYVSEREGISLVTPEESNAEDTIRTGQYGGKKIDVLVIGENIKSIEKNAFIGAKIRRLFLPASIEDIAWHAFYGCHVDSVQVIVDSYAAHHLLDAGNSENLDYDEVFILRPNGESTYSIVSGGNYADGRTSFIVPGVALDGTRITTIESGALGCRTSVSSLTIEDGIETIESYNFDNCDHIKELHLPDTLKTIGDSCFRKIGEDYDHEVMIDLPDNIISVGSNTFSVPGMVPPKAVFCFHKNSDTDKTFRREVVDCRFSYYEYLDWVMKYARRWSDGEYLDEIETRVLQYRGTNSHIYFPKIQNGYVAGDCIYSNDSVESVSLPEGYIEADSFSYCHNLKEIFLPSTMREAIDPWYCHDDLKIYIPAGSAIIDELIQYNGTSRVFPYTFYPGLSASASVSPSDISLALTYTDCDAFSVDPWPTGADLSTQEETAIILSFLEAVCSTNTGKKITLTSLQIPNLCGEEIQTHYFDARGNKVSMRYTIDTMLVASGKIKGTLFGVTAGATSVIGTCWITYNGMQYVIAPASPEHIVRSLGAMQTILSVDAAAALKDGLTLHVDALDVFGKNGFITYLMKVFLEAGINTTSLDTISQVAKAIESKSDEEYYENLKKLIEIGKGLS